ncbi:class I SAM-dependent methyltransferase [Arthrospira platensis]|uniref:class I SAM-dependent methyltransferase n=1 Tax=Limnospira TaxID=2596745 RepID=UPI0001C39321|nr:class I SAM-dependent methyltransferase [Arthrospira platensis]AMW29054.1 methyltransferase [Arthrospira platensis YZ]KDR55026.1 methyltransferase [Arthrospira platensis str. Paraca]MBD2667824.1 class I SAM-dependent methyltransferase [Arthrospira platensis FACHB-439]MBD2708635.1 class I SAM-dependent methyltransferase [Arthrospira platensis FACHB-835]MDF2212878.1 class I SAM-dependent methyltransferase [Arthrospira platensis NCB002]MDT9182821.1 class I SAM-dependent methyltransferase [Lim
MTIKPKTIPGLGDFLDPKFPIVSYDQGIPKFTIPNYTAFVQANAEFFSHPEWAKTYFDACHRYPKFKQRWQAVSGTWDDKIVVDIGCGPGNLYASLGGKPKLLIGVDVALGSLKMAREIGYTPVLADAHHLPFISGFADIVALNATVHHCDDMVKVLVEAARLLRPGGTLIVDHDPQLSAWNYRGLAMILYKIRLPLYRLFFRNLHIKYSERLAALKTEAHHRPGDGVTSALFYQNLRPLGFTVKLYPHNNTVGAEVVEGHFGQPPHWRYGLGQRLSGINRNTPEAALSLMCVAKKEQELPLETIPAELRID